MSLSDLSLEQVPERKPRADVRGSEPGEEIPRLGHGVRLRPGALEVLRVDLVETGPRTPREKAVASPEQRADHGPAMVDHHARSATGAQHTVDLLDRAA